jgi:vacuolar-type H+-ATPase subunit I/STV1
MEKKSMIIKNPKSAEAAKAALPFFGGTSPADTETESTTDSETSDKEVTATGSTTETKSEINTDPQAVADLVKQVETLNSTVNQLKKVNEKFESEKKTKERESMGREEALSKDLEEAQQTIVKMDQALRNQAVVNAINGFKDIEFHDIKFAMSKLSADVFDQMEVDLNNGTVTVNGIENDLRRIAKENEWAVKNKGSVTTNVNGNGQQKTPAGRPSGGAPNGSGGDASKATARKALAARFPVIMHGRSSI